MIITHLVMFEFFTGAGQPAEVVTPSTDARVPGAGGGHKRKSRAEKDTRRRRILLADGTIITPRNDEEYRILVAEIIEGQRVIEPPAPQKPRKRRIKGAVVQPTTPKMVNISAIPAEFYEGLELQRQGVLNYLSILQAWQVYLAAQDEADTEMLLLTVH